MRVLIDKVKEVLYSVLPIIIIVFFLHFTITPLSNVLIARFSIGSILIVLGLSVFLSGIDIGITPLGANIGSVLSKTNKIWVIVVVGAVLGFFVSVAEPDLQILAGQVAQVTSGQLSSIVILVVVSLGIAALLICGLIRIVYNTPIHHILTALYGIILIMSLFVSPEFLAISFDASGATTGALSVPFMLALALGISSLKKDSKASEEDSFGLVAITSIGAIVGLMLMGMFTKITGLTGSLSHEKLLETEIIRPFLRMFPSVALESALALLPILIICIAFQIKAFKFGRHKFVRMLKGLLYTLIGLVLFLTGVNVGFMDVGNVIGQKIALIDNQMYSIIIGFIIGIVTILAEPAVHILTDQIESVTSGYIRKSVVLIALAIGVGTAVSLSIVRIIVPGIELWHYLLPGYAIAVGLNYFIPKLFVGIAFDSGGIASGTMTGTFILAFMQGIADSHPGADVLKDAFGMIALVAMVPIITLQILGLIVKIKSQKTIKF